ncbi:MAG: radical SAM protein [Bacteroidales bacterium]|jgi:wyosine [tRNA(Phe)-imidazoG37] synthetase (radical SAM superfamily)|nr:radical SAM protein [Bacteroidales bacterium]
MSTLFHHLVFGPVQSRRLGVSLGVNLLPPDGKYCNFDCIYCECGWNRDGKSRSKLPGRAEIRAALMQKLAEMQTTGSIPDSITFAGNGEPTVHPQFPAIVDDVIELRNRYAPSAKISVLSNATMLHHADVIAALQKTDRPILKMDSGIASTIARINRPAADISVPELIARLQSFEGQCIIQTMFVHGTCDGKPVDNTTPEELDAWEQAVLAIRPKQLMIYTIDRDTPANTLRKASSQTLHKIARRMEKFGLQVQVAI